MRLDYRNTTINGAGLLDRREAIDKDILGQMMCDFWRTITTRLPHAIPPGIIFLPGERLSQEGFRWAPKTWMSAVEIDHPDPLNSFDCTTSLLPEGLLVQYPGFLLHCLDRKIIIGTDLGDTTFTFPVDRDLLEWYSVQQADKGKERTAHLYQIIEQSNDKKTQLAIILSRSRPKETPPEIGLLVMIYEPSQGKESVSGKYYCRIIHRVRVWRAKPQYSNDPFTKSNESEIYQRDSAGQPAADALPSILGIPSEFDRQICIGEIIDSDQKWVVDSFKPPEPPEPPEPEEPTKLRRQAEESTGPGESSKRQEVLEPTQTEVRLQPEPPVPEGVDPPSAPGAAGIEEPGTSSAKDGGAKARRTLLEVLWKKNPGSNTFPRDSKVTAPEQDIGTSGAPRKNLKSANTFSGESSSPFRRMTAPMRRFTERRPK
jgi:hypothetical protein